VLVFQPITNLNEKSPRVSSLSKTFQLEIFLYASFQFGMSRIHHFECSQHANQKHILLVTYNFKPKNESDQISYSINNHHLELYNSSKEIDHVEFLEEIGG